MTICTGELDGTHVVPKKGHHASVFFESKFIDWNNDHSIEHATELVTAALVEGEGERGRIAAEFLIKQGKKVPPTVALIAKRVLDPSIDLTTGSCSEGAILKSSEDEPADLIRNTRKSISRSPRNALLWVDLARAYTVLGQQRQAIKAMEVALGLQPLNRFVLRSASRMHVHFDDPARAHHILINSGTVRSDPWVLAAEISVGMIIDRSSRLVRTARNMLVALESSPLQTTELAGSLATLELHSGSLRQARKLFEKSLEGPNENSIAQVWWASKQIANISMKHDLLKTPLSFEARAREQYTQERWKDVIQHCENWFLDEPFSSRPAVLATYVAAEALEDYALCEKLSRRGLLANPSEEGLRNNLIYALANQDKLEEARTELTQIAGNAGSRETTCVLLATEGLLNFREGHYEAGRQLYLDAMELARRSNLPTVRASAAIHLAREEIRASTSNEKNALKMAEDECKRTTDVEVKRLLGVVKELYKKTSTIKK